MATVAQLNVRIGGEIKDLNKALKDAETAIRKSGATLSSWGNTLSTTLTLPLLAFGAAAIKSAGDIEALNKAMVATFAGAGRSAEAAQTEVDALRKAAEAPGLDFEQAIKASLRLQGVGFSAEKARNTIVQLANAIASTGGTAENLNGVTVQFAQMISKGKILTSDLNVIKENMPGLAKIMQETFGTTSADALRDMGVSGKEFVEKITAAMQKLPRVEGGISNSIVNAGTAIKMFLADVGESLNKTFNISGKLDAFATALNDIGKKFSEMSDGTQRAIAGVAVFALTIGPLIKGMGLLVQAGGAVYAGFLRLQIAFKSIEAGGLIAWWQSLNATMKLNIIGATIAIVLAAAAAFAVLSEDMGGSAQAARDVADVSKTAAEAIVGQKSQVETLVTAYKGEFTTLQGKKAILDQLNKISPEYFGGIRVGKGDVDAIALAQERYNEELLRTAKITAAKDKLVEIEKALLNLQETADPTIWQSVGNAFLSLGSGADFAGRQIKTVGGNIVDQTAALKKRRDEMLKIVSTDAAAAANTNTLTKSIKDNTSAVDDQAKAYAKLDKEAKVANRGKQTAEVKKFRAQGNTSALPTLDLIPDNMESGMQRAGKAVEDLKVVMTEVFGPTDDLIQRFNAGVMSFADAWDAASKIVEASGTRIQNVMFAAAQGAQDYAAKGGSSFKELGQAALAGGAKIIRSYIMQGVAAAVSKALQSVPFPFNLIAGGAAGAVAGTLFNKLLGALKIPAMARGGYSTGGMTLVGELGPELVNLPYGANVTPNHKLGSMSGSGSTSFNLIPSIHYDATGFRIMLEKEAKRNGRVNG